MDLPNSEIVLQVNSSTHLQPHLTLKSTSQVSKILCFHASGMEGEHRPAAFLSRILWTFYDVNLYDITITDV